MSGQRVNELLKAVARDLECEAPPLSTRFVEEWDVTHAEFQALCNAVAEALREKFAFPKTDDEI